MASKCCSRNLINNRLNMMKEAEIDSLRGMRVGLIEVEGGLGSHVQRGIREVKVQQKNLVKTLKLSPNFWINVPDLEHKK